MVFEVLKTEIPFRGVVLFVAAWCLVFFGQPREAAADCDPLQLKAGERYDYYNGVDCEGFEWDIVFKDYFQDEWRMKKVRENASAEYFVGNRYVPSNGKRYASSACIYHAVIGDVVSFVSQSWQREKALTYNMTWNSDTRISGCEYWLGADRWDSYYFRTGYIDLIRGTFGGKTAGGTMSQPATNEDEDGVAGVPGAVWSKADDEHLKLRLEPERYEEVRAARAALAVK